MIRVAAGRRLATVLEDLRDQDPVVLGLPRGGVVVAAEVARALDAPLDAIIVRKLEVPVQPELAMGAIGEDGVRITVAEDVMETGEDQRHRRPTAVVEQRERDELERRARLYRGERPRLALAGRPAIVVDDGIAHRSRPRRPPARWPGPMEAAPGTSWPFPSGLRRQVVDACPERPTGALHLETPTWLREPIGQFYGNFAQIGRRPGGSPCFGTRAPPAEVRPP